MRSNLVAYAAGLLLILTSGTAFAGRGPATEGQFVKNGFPCFAEVCIGDRIEDLSGFELQVSDPLARAHTPTELRNYAESFNAIYGFWEDAFARGPYIFFASPELVASADRFANVCTANFLIRAKYELKKALQVTGAYLSPSGHRTVVTLSLMPDPTDPQLRARFFVTGLTRFIEVPDPGEMIRVEASAKERYAAFIGRTPPTNDPWPRPFVAVAKTQKFPSPRERMAGAQPVPGVEIDLRMWGMLGDPREDLWKKVSSHPRCTTSTTRSLD